MNGIVNTLSLAELSKILQYETSHGCAQNMLRASRYAKLHYPSLFFDIKMDDRILGDGYIANTCLDGSMCRKASWLTAMFCANSMKRSAAAYIFLIQQFRDVPIEELVDFFTLPEGWDAQILQVLIGVPVRQDFVYLIKSTLNTVESKCPQIRSDFQRLPRSCNYILPLSTVKIIIHNLVNNKRFAHNPMNEFITRLYRYFLALDDFNARTGTTTVSEEIYDTGEDVSVLDSFKGIGSVEFPELSQQLDILEQSQNNDWNNELDLAERVIVDLLPPITEPLDLTIPLLLLVMLLLCLGWINAPGCG